MNCVDCGKPCAWQFDRCHDHRLIHRRKIEAYKAKLATYVILAREKQKKENEQ